MRGASRLGCAGWFCDKQTLRACRTQVPGQTLSSGEQCNRVSSGLESGDVETGSYSS